MDARAVSSAGRALPLHGRGHRFEPCTAHPVVRIPSMPLLRGIDVCPVARELSAPVQTVGSKGQLGAVGVRLAVGHAGTARGWAALPVAARGPVSAVLGRDDVRYRVRSARARLVARNPAQGLVVGFAPDGLRVRNGRSRQPSRGYAHRAGWPLSEAYRQPERPSRRTFHESGGSCARRCPPLTSAPASARGRTVSGAPAVFVAAGSPSSVV